MNCPIHNKMRQELPPLPPRMQKLPVDERGYPVPYFVAWLDGKPEFRMADPVKLRDALKFGKCWVCGEKVGKHMAFVIGPMCAINKITTEPPSHVECALWSVRGCPFLSKPKMVRREDELTEACKDNVAGIMSERNPGVSIVWVTHRYSFIRDDRGKPLIQLGPPVDISAWREGRPATKEEIRESVESGFPRLWEVCRNEAEQKDLLRYKAEGEKILGI